jgi:hypothetical protein
MPDPYLATTDSQYSRERTGIRKVTVVYIIPRTGETEPYEELDSWVPTARPLNLPETERKATKRTDGDWDLAITFEGMPAGAKAVGFAELDHSSVEDPIETFEKFDALKDKYKGKVVTNAEGVPKFEGWAYKIDDPQSGEKVKNPMFGTSHFLNDNTVMRVTFAHPKFFRELLRDICKIQKPIVPDGQNELLVPIENKTWLKKSVRARWRGNVWEYEIEYLLGNWAPDIYKSLADSVNDFPKIAGPDGSALAMAA